MPPSTRGSSGFSAATASAASVTIRENARHSGSCSKAQCDLLLGSFQNITASIIKSWASRGVARSHLGAGGVRPTLPAEQLQRGAIAVERADIHVRLAR